MTIKISNSSFKCGKCGKVTLIDNYAGDKSIYCECGHCLISINGKINVPEEGLNINGGLIFENNS